MTPALELRGVHKAFSKAVPLAGLDLTVLPGQVVAFLGPNGAGKTTTVRIVLGLLRADRGEVRALGLDPQTPRGGDDVRAKVGAVLDHDGLYDRLTALHNLELHADLRGLRARDGSAGCRRIEELLRRFGLWERRSERVGAFSKGMRQKLALARALLHRPRLLLLDEPFTGLDPGAAIEVRDDLRRLAREEQTAVFVATHDLHHVERACDHVVFLNAGRAVHAGTTAEFASRGATADQIALYVEGYGLTREVVDRMVSDDALLDATPARSGFVVRCTEKQRKTLSSRFVAHGVELLELTPERRTLEEAFVSLASEETGT